MRYKIVSHKDPNVEETLSEDFFTVEEAALAALESLGYGLVRIDVVRAKKWCEQCHKIRGGKSKPAMCGLPKGHKGHHHWFSL